MIRRQPSMEEVYRTPAPKVTLTLDLDEAQAALVAIDQHEASYAIDRPGYASSGYMALRRALAHAIAAAK